MATKVTLMAALTAHRSQPWASPGAHARTCMMHTQATAKHLAQAPNLRQLPVTVVQTRECALAEDVHLLICMIGLAGSD